MRVLSYRERLRLPVLWVVTALGVAVVLAAEIHAGAGGWRAVVPYLVLPPLAAAWSVLASRRQVRVEDGVLHVPGARAPLTAFGEPRVLDRETLRRVLGPQADARAFVAVTSWVGTGVLLPVVDPEDDTPYWVVATRRPEELAAALTAPATRA